MKQAMERLELEAVQKALDVRTRTPLGASVVQKLAPLDDIASAKARIESIRQTRVLIDKGEPPPVWGAHDVEASLELGEKGIMLEGAALRAIAHTMTTGSLLRKHLLAHEQEAPALFGLAASLTDLSRVASEVLGCFDPDGTLADHASKELGPLRQRVRSLKESIQSKLSELLRSEKMQRLLQEDYYTIRGDRYVLPVVASFKNDVEGIVHDASGSGQTVYIEPQALVDLGNRLKIAQSAQLEEEHRILSSLTRLVTREADMVRAMTEVIGTCDFFSACARLALDLDMVPVPPDDGPGFNLVRARHPLLLLQAFVDDEGQEKAQRQREDVRVVPNDLGIGDERQILVVTGPNTGGKTVAMKTVGLCALMVRCGLHIPCAEGSKMGWYRKIEAAIGDQQSIASNLSTFAAHVMSIVNILKVADQSTLVLIDEVAADTDPTQGAALAQAILERVADNDAHAVVTTHFERLKAVPFADDRFRNAGVGFDPVALRPTYRVTLDVPQGSSGFDIAQSLGLEAGVVERARELLGTGAGDLERLMKELEQRSAALEQARQEADEAQRAIETERAELQKAREKLDGEVKRIRQESREELLAEIGAAREEVRTIMAELRAHGVEAKAAMQKASAGSERIAELQRQETSKQEEAAAEEAGTPLAQVAIGDWVHVAKIGRDGDVVGLDDKDVHVVVGNMRMRVSRKQILPPKTHRPRRTPRPDPKGFKRAMREAKTRETSAASRVTEPIDVRGLTVDECLDRLEVFLDHHYGRPTTHVQIIHGVGTGALREAIRDHLVRSGYVRSTRPGEPGEGGDGVTVVTLA